jgi:RND family efflux transporter MFP subunit
MKSDLSSHGATPARPRPTKQSLGLKIGGSVLWLGTVAGVLLWATGCAPASKPASGDKSIDVEIAQPVTGQVVDFEEFTGRLDALKTTDIRPRVSGYVTKAPFKEGDEVHEGKLLFEIDPQTYQADLNQAEANLKLAEADSRLQQKIAARSQRLDRTASVAREEAETAAATAEKAKATVKAMEAARDRAKLYFGWTKVTAPWTGRISRRLVDPGNLVNADNTVLTTMVTDDSLYAYFDVDERTYLNLMESLASKATSLGNSDAPVVFRLANESDFSRIATVNFIDNRVNAATGTIRMRGVFANETKTFKPGLFVRIRLPIGVPYQAILVPDEAVLSDQGRKYVFVVDGQNKVVYRPVTIGQETGGWRVVKEGVKLDDKVIIAGMQRVREGSLVKLTEKQPPKPSESRLVQLLNQYLTKKNGDKENGKQGDRETMRQGDQETRRPGDKEKRDVPTPAGN